MFHRIDRAFIDRILDGEDAAEAIASLSHYVGPRDMQAPGLGMSRPESALYHFCWYSYEVGNGGHLQYFRNPTGGRVIQTQECLEEMGLLDLRDILCEACSVFPGPIPRDQDERGELIGTLPEESLTTWESLDRRFHELTSASDEVVLAYLRRRRSEILTLETS